jgi:hypothetical protein
MRDQVVRRPEAGSPSRHMGPYSDPSSTNDFARQYLAAPLTRACGSAGSPRVARVSDRSPSRRRYIYRGCMGSQSAVDGRLARPITELPLRVRPRLDRFIQVIAAPLSTEHAARPKLRV